MRGQLQFTAYLMVAAAFVVASSQGRAEHALTQDGHALFNVYVEQTATTWSRPLRVRFQSGSFEYDYQQHAIVNAFDGGTGLYWIADVVSTSTQVGKEEGRLLMQQLGWHRYTPPPPRVIVLPTPTPVPTTTPAPEVAQIDPNELADQSLPLEERLEAQRQIFIDQQRALADRLLLDKRMHQSDDERGKQERIRLLKRQIEILNTYYPKNEHRVRLTREALEDQLRKVDETGKFSWEL
ncbi:MAG: hypothetical protein KatS3mg130_2034 [Candidatus Sumerlaea sp.]|nr:MAG: hypothetical protein KatS3mg130_2034 [Candidatus Sumerlaea sp.]